MGAPWIFRLATLAPGVARWRAVTPTGAWALAAMLVAKIITLAVAAAAAAATTVVAGRKFAQMLAAAAGRRS